MSINEVETTATNPVPPASPSSTPRGSQIKMIALSVVALLGLLAAFVAAQPAHYQVKRSSTISAAPEIVFEQVNDFHKWEAWSPWAQLDPDAKNSFEGAPAGKGANFKWSGNDKVGEGSMTIIESNPPDLIRIDLTFVRPMQDTCITEFTFVPNGETTTITWTMSGNKNFISKAVCLFMDMDKMVGGDFEKGLAQLKSISEGAEKSETGAGADEGEMLDE